MAEVIAERTVLDLGVLLSGSNLREDTVGRIVRNTRRCLPHIGEVLTVGLGFNPRCHFTPESFHFQPDNHSDQTDVIKSCQKKGWYVGKDPTGIRVETWHSLNIRQNGLREGTYVTALPEGTSLELVRYHPRLAFSFLRNTIVRFGKHAAPYKELVFNSMPGTLSQITGGVVIISEDVPVQTTDGVVRERLCASNLLRPREYTLLDGASPDKIVVIARFPIPGTIKTGDSSFTANKLELCEMAINAILISLSTESSKYLPDGYSEAIQHAIALFSTFHGRGRF